MAKFVTKEGLEKMKQELEYLKTTKQRELAERLRRAISYGDLSENFEYADAKEEQTMLQAKIAQLQEEIAEAKVIENGGKSDVVEIGSQVEIELGGNSMQYIIVTAQEANLTEGKISAESPIGSSLLGKKVGDTALCETPSGPMKCKIIRIS